MAGAGIGWRLGQILILCGCLALIAPHYRVGAAEQDLRLDGNRARAAVDLSPVALAIAPDNHALYVACGTAAEVKAVDLLTSQGCNRIALPLPASGLALSADGAHLFVTCPGPVSRVCEIDTATLQLVRSWSGRHTSLSPVLSPDGRTLYVCDRFSGSVSVYNIADGKEVSCIPVEREPIAAALTRDGRTLLVAHHLPSGRVDKHSMGASVSVIDLAEHKVRKVLPLPNGSTLLRDIKVSPDGAYACVTHGLARFQMPTTQLERGWMNTSALTLLDLQKEIVLNTVLLDEIDRGAANPWALGWSADGRRLCVTHAGTHEVSVIRFPELIAKLRALAGVPASGQSSSGSGAQTAADVPNDLAFLVGLRERIKLEGIGPRALAVAGNGVYVAGYFSDTVERIELETGRGLKPVIRISEPHQMSEVRRGEMLFNDADLSFQGWQSCASCHSQDGRVDGLDWDLLNDGIGNPKNTKSLLLVHETPPAMSTGVRESAEAAVRAGIRHILFSVQPESVATALDAWLRSLKPVPSPALEDGCLSPAARRGERLFRSARVGCAGCHPAELWTNLKEYDVGTAGPLDQGATAFDTPALVEVWRTAPYLHDGSAATLREVLITRNGNDRHGRTSQLTDGEIEDLLQYLLSL